MRRRTSSADQCAVRSAATARRAPANVPSEFGARSQVWPLSRCVWTSIRHGQTWPRRRSTLGSEASGTDAGGSTAAMRASRMTTSTTASPSGDSDTPGGRSVRNAAGTVALRSRYALCSGTVTKSSAAPGELTIALQPSRATALSCHFRRIRCDSAVNARKMRIPVHVIIKSAANMRGICIVYPDSRMR